jgi:uncharacterized protein (TIGR04255 family)
MGVRMSKPPIFYIIGQVQFSPILEMRQYVPKIQEQLRKEFPDFKEDAINAFQLQFESGKPKPAFNQTSRWHFNKPDGMSGFLLQPTSLSFHTTAYNTFEPFLADMMRGIEIVHKAAALGLVESVAIRTLDVVVPEAETKVQQYLNPQACGLSEDLDGELRQSSVECVRDFPPHGALISRVAIVNGSLGMPMDLYPLTLELKPKLKTLNTWHAILDNDRQEKRRFDFDPGSIRTGLTEVKKGATEAFLKSVSPFALDRWR